MADILLPPGLTIARNRFRYIDSTGVARNPHTGTVRTASRGGDRIGSSLEVTPAGGGSSDSQRDRAQLLAFIMSMRGRQNRAYLWDHGYRIRGSFSATELLSNNDFSNGTTGWTTGSEYGVSVHDQVARCVRTKVTMSQPVLASSAATVTQYAVYVARAMLVHGRGAFGNVGLYFGSTSAGTDYGPGSSINSSFGFYTVAGAAIATTAYPTPVDLASSGLIAGDYMDIPFISLARCALVDNSPNLLTYSDQFDNAAWTKSGSSITANAIAAPDNTTTADRLVESSGGSAHYISQAATKSATSEDWTGTVCAKANSRTQCRLVIGDNGSNWGSVYINLSTGAILSGPSAAGTVTNARASSTSLGDGWYRISLTARIPSSITTSNQLALYLANGGTSSYSGDGASNISIWRGAYARSGAPFLPMQTTSAGDSDGTAQTGSALNVKGLPVSTNGLLLPGDWFEVITSYGSELKMVTAALNSDAAGIGYLQFSPPLRGTPADNAAVIINQPMGRFVFAGDAMEWMTDPGIMSAASFDFEEAVG